MVKKFYIQIDRKSSVWCFACLCRDACHTAVYASHALLPHHLLDQLLMATGRHANTADLGVQAADVEVDATGVVIIDNRMCTSVPQICAAGDCTNRPQYVYVMEAAVF